MNSVREINLDGSQWRSGFDFYRDLKAALGSPAWHGSSVDAIIDSIVFGWGKINAVKPPYVVRVHNTAGLPAEAALELRRADQALAEARAERFERDGEDCGTRFEIVS